mmetsp:Transcript_89109/g.260473  ORF Transcript_89109/g.260473 Transcript_89109/m.260473 type:complete len:213 (+) Transcript_89109:877-1515(+)
MYWPSGKPAQAAAFNSSKELWGKGTTQTWFPEILDNTPMNSGTFCSPEGMALTLKASGFSPAGRSPIGNRLTAQRSWIGGGSGPSPRNTRDQFLMNAIWASASTTPCWTSMPITVPPAGSRVIFNERIGASGLPRSGSMLSLAGTYISWASLGKKQGDVWLKAVGRCLMASDADMSRLGAVQTCTGTPALLSSTAVGGEPGGAEAYRPQKTG